MPQHCYFPSFAYPRSIDLTPIEHIWDHLGRRVRHPTSLNELEARRLDFYLLVHGRYFISLLPPIGNQWRRSPIRHLGTRPLGVTGSPEVICSMQTLPRSSTDAQSHLGMPNRRNKVTKNGNGPSEGLFVGTPVQP
ncbi:hypothetical protein TNCV_3017961 [Trichonephila clavipes]|nr:hypothetical protein TNCV_3017961 [Trichonephila clavipes]